MGMAASQARLLMITSRQHDVELKAQQLQNAKLQLSTQQDEVYEDYQKALDATTFTASFTDRVSGAKSTLPVTFNNLFSLDAATSSLQTGSNYILRDNNGRVVVDDDVYDMYQDFGAYHGEFQSPGWTDHLHGLADNAYMFAMYMLNGGVANTYNGGDQGIYAGLDKVLDDNYGQDEPDAQLLTNYFNDVCQDLISLATNVKVEDGTSYTHLNSNQLSFEINSGGNIIATSTNTSYPGYTGIIYRNQVIQAFQCIYNGGGSVNGWTFSAPSQDMKDHFDDLSQYMFTKYSGTIFNNEDESIYGNYNHNSVEFNYYVRLYTAIQQYGCIAISNYNNDAGPAANNNEWLTAMLQSGQMSIMTVTQDANTGDITLSGTSVASDGDLSYTASSSIDKVALAQAEADYEHALKVIDRKEQKIDRELNKIETERSALTKQYDSIKKVSDENIDRTFGIFS